MSSVPGLNGTEDDDAFVLYLDVLVHQHDQALGLVIISLSGSVGSLAS